MSNKKSFTMVTISFVILLLSVAVLLVGVSLLPARSAPSSETSSNDSANAQSADKYELLDARLAKNDYTYVMYGVLEDIHTLIGDDEVVVTAIRAVKKGGMDYNEYGWRTAFAPSKMFEDIGMETYISDDGTKHWMTLSGIEPRYWKLTMTNSADGGGSVRLPEFILSAEEIDAADIPMWAGK